MKTPNFFIVGAPKSGTSAIYSYLQQHPEIWMSTLKEPQFFGTDIKADHFIRNYDRYLALFEGARDENLIGEASVWYLYSTRAAEEIKEFCPQAKIIIMLRNPVEMIYSLHSQLLYNKTEDIEDFEQALKLEKKRKNGENFPLNSTGPLQALFYTETAKYANQVKRYLDVFGRDNIHFIFYEEFKHDSQKIYRELLNFLQVDSEHIIDLKVMNSHKKIKNRSIQNFLAKPPSFIARSGNFLLPKSLKHRILKNLMILNTDYSSRSPLNCNLKSKLNSIFHEDIVELSNLLNRDLTHIWI